MINKILECNIPGEFWNTVKYIGKKDVNDPSSNILPKEWFEYFNKLMNIGCDHDIENDCVNSEFLTFRD